jgi:hypothetical protein
MKKYVHIQRKNREELLMKNLRSNAKVLARKALNNYLIEVETASQHLASAETRFNDVMTDDRFNSILEEVAACEEF